MNPEDLKTLHPGAQLLLRDGRVVTFQDYGHHGELICRGDRGVDDVHFWQADGRWEDCESCFVSDADIVDLIEETLF